MVKGMGIRVKGWSAFVGLLLLAILACSTPGSTPSPTRPPTNTPAPTNTAGPLDPTRTLTAPETLPANIPLTFTPAATLTSLPTFTPFRPTLAATITPSTTPGPQPRPTLRPTRSVTGTPAAPPADSGPLSFTFDITWRISSDDPMEATATVNIFPSGGGGGYNYTWDEQPVKNPFEYNWRVCKGNPSSITVESADGQKVSQDYFERPPCPTPTIPPPP